jgi:hypothetical protein
MKGYKQKYFEKKNIRKNHEMAIIFRLKIISHDHYFSI